MTGNGISLHCRLPTGNCGLNATLDVPSHTAVDLTSGGGNMQVSGIQGNVTLDSGGGDVGISGIGGTADRADRRRQPDRQRPRRHPDVHHQRR